MEQNKIKSFVLYTDYVKHISLLTDEEAGKLLFAIFEYVESGKKPDFSGALMMCFSFIAEQLARDKEKYQDVCKKRAEAGRKGGKQKQANLANASNCNQKIADLADTENGNKNNTKNDDENDKKYSTDFQVFWKIYPRHIDKGQCYKKYKARLNDGYSPEELLQAATNYANQCRRDKTEQKFIKHGKTFLGDSLPFTDFIPKLNQPVQARPADTGTNPFKVLREK